MKKSVLLGVFFVVLGVLSRIVPHLSNFSPLLPLALLSGVLYSRKIAAALVVLTLLLGDLIIGFQLGYPTMGAWSLFTYTGVIAVMLLGAALPHLESRFVIGLLAALGSALGFWVWTNMGVWCFSSLYLPHSASSLILCFLRALPFLQHELLGCVCWMPVLCLLLKRVAQSKPLRATPNWV